MIRVSPRVYTYSLPPRIFYTVVYNLFPGVSALGASVLGYSLPLEFSTLSSIEYIISYQEILQLVASVLGYSLAQ